MAEGNPSFVADRILELLRSEDIKELGPVEPLKGLEMIISIMRDILLQAEKTDLIGELNDLLMKMEDMLYDADNLMDELSTVALQRRLMSSGEKTSKLNKVRGIFSASNLATYLFKVTREVDEIMKRVKGILTIAYNFNVHHVHLTIREHSDRFRPRVGGETHSFVARDDDKMKIISILLDTESEGNITVLPIVGIGGIGKTALAQVVFNEESVKEHFELRVWLFVSQEFDIKRIFREIVNAATSHSTGDLETEDLRRLLRDTVDKKRYLIVLDDVWSEDREKWDSMMSNLEDGARGSKIIVTTRSEKVARIAGTIPPHFLHDLNLEQSWNLFKLEVFNGEEPKHIYQKEIGMKIVRKCGGVPLAINVIGRMLYSRDESDWVRILDSNFSTLEDPYGDGILSTLKLSYNTLPSHLRHCFAYCSLFPKDHEFDVQMMIKLWMAQGFIEPQVPSESLEDVCYQYFFELLKNSFFQESKRDLRGFVTKFKIHDLVHDLAIHLAGKQCATLSSETHQINERTSHVSFSDALFSAEQIPASLIEAKKIRSILLPSQLLPEFRGRAEEIFKFIVPRFRLLRTLDMHALGIKKVPTSIGNLLHLRYLDLSENGDITKLPDSITKLVNLQTLRLSSCFKLKKLPRDIANLVNLRHLEIDGCENLAALPQGIAKLTNLQTLSQLTVSEDDSTQSNEPKQPKGLQNLTGINLKNLRHGRDVMTSYLNRARESQPVSLEWESRAPKSDNIAPLDIDLRSKMKDLTLIGFWGETLFRPGFPSNLVKLTLRRWVKGTNLAPLKQCSKLKVLVLDEITNLEFILDDVEIESGSVSSSTKSPFPYLEELWLTELPKLRGWWKSEANNEKWPSFPYISKLVIEDCPKLVSVPLFSTLEGLVLDSTCWNPYYLTSEQNLPTTAADKASSSSTETSSPLSNLRNLCMVGIDVLDDSKAAEEIAWDTLQSLRLLKLDSLPKLTALPKGLQHVSSLQELHIWRCHVKEIPAWIGKLTLLEKLTIRVCPEIKSLPQEICSLKNLKTLEIEECPTLMKRCEKGTGADWDKINKDTALRLGR